MTQNLGLHLTLDLINCKEERLTDQGRIYDFLLKLPKVIDMQIMTLPYVVKWLDKDTKVEGISGFVMIAESHISIHTYPEKRGVYVDVFSCKGFHIHNTINEFLKEFECKIASKHVVKRGFVPE